MIGVVWPPIPGGLLTLGAIPIVGWQTAYIVDFTASTTGSVIAYYIGKKYGLTFLKKIFDEATIKRIKNIKVKKNRQIETVIIMRVLFGTTIVEAVSYAAGLIKIDAPQFAIGAAISHMIVAIPIFYFAGNIFSNQNLLINMLVLFIAIPLLWKFRSRYFE